VTLRACRDVDELRASVEDARPHLVVSNQEAATMAAPLAARLGVPRVHWFHSFEYAPPSRTERRAWGTSLDRVYPGAGDRQLAASADLRLTSSSFLRGWYRRRTGVSSRICYPTFLPHAWPRGDARNRGEYVTGICGWAYKGADVFFDLARRFPDVPFLLVGTVAPEYRVPLQGLANVRQGVWPTPRPFLAISRIVLVPSRWPEPFGRIAVEAMASGIPTLVSATGGLPEAVGGSALHMVRHFRSPDAWAKRLEVLLTDDRAREANVTAGLRLSRRWVGGTSLRRIAPALRALVAARTVAADCRPVIALAGGSQQATAFAMVNARWREALTRRSHVRLISPDGADKQEAGVVPDVTIHHDLTRRFDGGSLPPGGHAVAVRTWDFGPYPSAWVRTIAEKYDELWVHSRWIRQQAIRGGVLARRVRVVPLGVDPADFRSDGPQLRLPTTKSLRLLFVGAPVLRKGIDILLRAWRVAFRREDDVCLIVKANPKDVFYEGIDWRAQIREQAAGGAEIVLVDRLMPASALAGLYRTCHASVFPYRAEGFGLPILEAMACGCPPIVPRFGACLDYCDAGSAHFVHARRVQVPVNRTFAFNTLGFEEEVQEVDFCEVSVDALAEVLVRVARMGAEERSAIARRAAAKAARFTWEASAAAVERAVSEVTAGGVPVRLRRARRDRAQQARRESAARLLLSAARRAPKR
jgi:glycosyltransferase involved in cell wall biosynthesis